MITLFCKKFNCKNEKEYENQYSTLINNLNIPLLECSCKQIGTLSIHAYYDRCIKTSFGKVKLRILRLICSSCKKTHALLPSFIVPYSQIRIEDQIDIINTGTCILFEYGQIDINTIKRIKSNYLLYFKARLYSFNINLYDDINELTSKCIYAFRKQFMQIHRGLILYNSLTT